MEHDIQIVDLAPQPVLVIEASVAPPELGDALARILPRVDGYIRDHGGERAGMPFMRYLGMTDHFRIDAGIPVVSAIDGQDDIVGKVLPGGKTATTLFLGQYHLVGSAWDAMFAWGKDRDIEQHFGGWDVYENDPTQVRDPAEIRTRLYYPFVASG